MLLSALSQVTPKTCSRCQYTSARRAQETYLLLDTKLAESLDEALREMLASVGGCETENRYVRLHNAGNPNKYVPDEVKDDVADLATIVPVRSDPEKREDIWACPTIHTNMDATWQALWG